MATPEQQITQSLRALADAFGQAAAAYVERMRPLIQAMGRFADDPAFRAMAERMKARACRPCHCLCITTHPAQAGICEPGQAVITRRFTSAITGPVDVPLCTPCAAAQGIAELDARPWPGMAQ